MAAEPEKHASPRWPFLLALAIPVLAGLAYMWVYGAPTRYLAINAAALLAGLMLASQSFGNITARKLQIASSVLLAVFALPLVTGPEMNGIARWIPISGFILHAGMATIPALIVIAAQREDCSPIILLIAAAIALLQPDAGSGLAISFACIALASATHVWQPALVAATAFIAAMIADIRGLLPPQEFVERVFVDAFNFGVLPGLGLAAAMVSALVLILFLPGASRATRYGLAGSFIGLTFISTTSHYPTPLIGFGAAPILGYGLALGLARGLARNLKAEVA